ncbi:MAG: hypothetical protein QOF02_2178 [Blastocatellia bacterium]|jgi:CHAT domain-containing protein/tetratricopeptide (TPR) repeat protein|nr:hypothetical protein [Blastocatellia bacterium]
MMNQRLSLPLILVFILSCAASLRAQNDNDVLSRDGDESATTKDERQSALAILSTAARQSRSAGEAAKAARFLNRVGRLQLQLALPQDALVTYQDALTSIKRTPDPTVYIDTLNGLGAAHNRLSNCEQAEVFLRRAIALSESNAYVAGKAEALFTLSDCRNYNDHALAIKTAQESLTLWQSLKHQRGSAKTYIALGDYQLALNKLTEAAASYEAALNIWRELDVKAGQAEALISLGFLEYRKGAWQNVFAFFSRAQALLDEKAEPLMMGQISAGLAETFIESGMPETGLVKYREAFELYSQAQNLRYQVAMAWGIGKTLYISGNYTEAIENLERALADAEAIKEIKVVALCHDFLGRTLGATDDHAAALRHFEIALNLYTHLSSPREAARVRALMGRNFQQQGQIEKAKKYYKSALETFVAIADDVNRSATLYALGSLELSRDNLAEAETYLRQSIEVTENMRRAATSRDLTTAFSATVYERYESYVECLMRKHQAEPGRGFDALAFETSDAARARSLVELLRATQTNLAPGLDPQLAAREQSLRQTLRAKDDFKVELLSGKYKPEQLAAVEAELARLEAELKEVNEEIAARYPAYAQMTRPVPLSLRQIQQQVIADDQTMLLEYSLGATKSYVWAVTRDGIKSFELAAPKLINDAAQRFYKLLAAEPGRNGADEWTTAAQELSRLVLSPVAAELNKHRIIVVADGALHYVPFQALLSPSSSFNEPLADNYEVVNDPSASILGELRDEAARRKPAAMLLAAFGDPVFNSDYKQRAAANGGGRLAAMLALGLMHWRHAVRDIALSGDSFDPATIDPLMYAKLELNNLRDVTAVGETFMALDFDATRERLQNTDLTRFAILHLATHGFLDPQRPAKSGLVFSTVNRDGQAQDGFLGLQDIYNLHAPVEMVVLSACRTALGKEVRGEGFIGLTRGFMYAGASSVVASLWQADDEATSELMKIFYVNMLQNGMTPAAALRAAQNSIRQRPEWRSPHYWAAFTLQGEYRQLIKSTPVADAPAYSKMIMGGALLMLLALLAGAGWLYRRRRWRRAVRRAESYSTANK